MTVSEGTNILVGTDPEKILQATEDILAGKIKAACVPPLWDGRAAERIVEVLLKSLTREEATAAVLQQDLCSQESNFPT